METCVKCNEEFTNTITDYAFDEWCENCADMHLFESEHSGDYFPRSERINVKGHYIHESEEEEFLDDNYECCEKCGSHVEEELNTVDNMECCDSCKEEAYWDDFAEKYTFDEVEQVADTRGMYVSCENYGDYDIYRCEHCSELYTYESIDYRDREHEWICNECWGEHYISNERINSYDYKPTAVFYQGKNQQQGKYFKAKGVYFGIELEIAHDDVDDLISDVPEMVDNDKFYLKEDGSIEGVELVTHPLTYSAIKEYNFKQLLKDIVGANGTSHDAGNCGLHIHVSKNKVPATSWWKIIYFFQECSDFINKFSRRNDKGYCHSRQTYEYGFNKEKGILLDDYKRYPSSPNKYSEINTSSNTVEFRVFRGTLKYQTFLASVQFTKAIIEFCNDHGIVYMGSLSSPSMLWSEFISYISKNNNYGHLIKYLKKRDIYRLESNISRSIKDDGKLSVSKFLTGKRDKINLSSLPKVINTLREEDCTLLVYNDNEIYPFQMSSNTFPFNVNPVRQVYCAITGGFVSGADSRYRSSSDSITKQVDFFNIGTKVVYGIVHQYSDAKNYYILLDDSHKEVVEGAIQGSGFAELHDKCNELIHSNMDSLLEAQLEQTTNL